MSEKSSKKPRGRPKKTPLDPPASLDDSSRALWKRTIEQATEQGTWAMVDLPLLERYVRAVEVARHARARITARAKVDPDRGYFTLGSQGQLVAHPDVKMAREAERDASDYADDLLLTSKARRRHNIKPHAGQPGKLEAILGGLSEPPGARAAGGARKRGG